MLDIKALLGDLPAGIQYIAIIGLIMLILYVCLMLTRLLGQGRGTQTHYDDPEAYEKTVPDLFASTFLKRKAKESFPDKSEENKEEGKKEDGAE